MIPYTGFYKQEILSRKRCPSLSLNFHLDFIPKAPVSHTHCVIIIPTLSVSSASFLHSPLAKHTLHSHPYRLHLKTLPQIKNTEVTATHLQPYLQSFMPPPALGPPSITADFPDSPMLAFGLQRLPRPLLSQMKSHHFIHIKANISEKGILPR